MRRPLRRRHGHARPLNAAERSHSIRWYGRKYGLSADEAVRLAGSRRSMDIENMLDAWRRRNGEPALTSPVTRGALLAIMAEEGV